MADIIKNKTKKEPKYVSEWKYKKTVKSLNMWIEQILLNQNKMKKDIEGLKKTERFISDFLDIKDKVDNIE